MIRVVGAIWMSTYGDARSRRRTRCPRPRKKGDSSGAKREPRTRLEKAAAGMPEMLSLMVKTKQCSNEQQLTSNVPVAASHNRLLWVGIEISEHNHSISAPKEEKKKENVPPLFLSFSSSWFLSCSMSLFNLAFSSISFFSSLTLAWATAAKKSLVTSQQRSRNSSATGQTAFQANANTQLTRLWRLLTWKQSTVV